MSMTTASPMVKTSSFYQNGHLGHLPPKQGAAQVAALLHYRMHHFLQVDRE
jgi:hypothetical protein